MEAALSICDLEQRDAALEVLAPLATETPVALLLVGALVGVHRDDFALARALVPWVRAGGADRRLAAMLTAHSLPEPLVEALQERGFPLGISATNVLFERAGDEAEHLRRLGEEFRRQGIALARAPLLSDPHLLLDGGDPLPELTRAARADRRTGPAGAAWLLVSSDPLDRLEGMRRLTPERAHPALGLLVARLDDPVEAVRSGVWELLCSGRITQGRFGVADALEVAAEVAIDDRNARVGQLAQRWLPRRSRRYL